MRSRFFSEFTKKMSEEMEPLCDFVIGGGPEDYPSYRERVGFLLGLKRAWELAEQADDFVMGASQSASDRPA